MASNSLNWTNWLKFKNIWVWNESKNCFQSKNKSNLIPEDSGVYEVRCVQENGKPIQIQRANGVDTEGILYIGSSCDLGERIKTFWRGVNENLPPAQLKVPHSGANTYAIFQFSKKFPLDSLEVRWAVVSGTPSSSNQDPWKVVEKALLEDYMARFLDKPPLNLSIMRW